MAERDESSGLQAFKYDGGGWRDSTRSTVLQRQVEGPAVTKPLPAGWVRQQRGALARVSCAQCCKLIEGAVDEADRCLHAAGCSEELERTVWPATVMQMTNKSDSGGGCASVQAMSWLSDPSARDPGLPIYTAPAIEPVVAFGAVEARQGGLLALKDRAHCAADQAPNEQVRQAAPDGRGIGRENGRVGCSHPPVERKEVEESREGGRARGEGGRLRGRLRLGRKRRAGLG